MSDAAPASLPNARTTTNKTLLQTYLAADQELRTALEASVDFIKIYANKQRKKHAEAEAKAEAEERAKQLTPFAQVTETFWAGDDIVPPRLLFELSTARYFRVTELRCHSSIGHFSNFPIHSYHPCTVHVAGAAMGA